MAGFTDYLENKIMDHVVGKTSYTMPSTWIALFTVTPSDTGGGTECTGGSYARKATAGSDWTAAAAGLATNATALTFVTATGSWGGSIVAAALMDASTAGNMLIWGPLTVAKTVSSGDTLTFAIGDIDFTLD